MVQCQTAMTNRPTLERTANPHPDPLPFERERELLGDDFGNGFGTFDADEALVEAAVEIG